MIVDHKWNRTQGKTIVEKFFYTDKAEYFSDYDTQRKHKYYGGRPKEKFHPARVLLDRETGTFSVEWSTDDMNPVSADTLKEFRKALQEYLDTVRSGKLVSNMDEWDKVIYWSHYGEPDRALALRDEEGKLIRFAPWNARQKQYIPEGGGNYYSYRHQRVEPFTDKRLREAKEHYKLQKAYDNANRQFEGAQRDFHVQDKDKPYLQVLKEAATAMAKWAAALDRCQKAKDARKKKAKKK
jgi:hypothetical protein